MRFQAVRAELAHLYTVAFPSWSVYDYVPGSANLQSIVIGLPDSLTPNVTGSFWRMVVPVYVVTGSADPEAQETALLSVIPEVVAAVDGTRGASFASARSTEVREFFDIQLGQSSALSCSIMVELMIPVPH